jgi:hypothetical protein
MRDIIKDWLTKLDQVYYPLIFTIAQKHFNYLKSIIKQKVYANLFKCLARKLGWKDL